MADERSADREARSEAGFTSDQAMTFDPVPKTVPTEFALAERRGSRAASVIYS